MMDTELQQRACEYRSLSANMSLANKAVEPMQPFQKRQSLLLRTMAKKNVSSPGVPCTYGTFILGLLANQGET